MLVTITGAPGVGKTSVCAALRLRGWRVVSAGDIMRARAVELGISITEMQRRAEADDSIDRMIDQASRNLFVGDGEKVVLDARMGWAFAPPGRCLTVGLFCDAQVAGLRVFEAGRENERYGGAAEAVAALRERRELEAERYKRLYGLTYDEAVFDLRFETTDMPPEVIASIIEEHAVEFEADIRLGSIGPFSGEYAWLSNTWPCFCVVDGIEFGSSEACYQALKVDDPNLRRTIASMDGKSAKAYVHDLGIDVELRTKTELMRRALWAKFGENRELRDKLISTSGFSLVEVNTRHDSWFGICRCPSCIDKPGANVLGRELMQIRKVLRERREVVS